MVSAVVEKAAKVSNGSGRVTEGADGTDLLNTGFGAPAPRTDLCRLAGSSQKNGSDLASGCEPLKQKQNMSQPSESPSGDSGKKEQTGIINSFLQGYYQGRRLSLFEIGAGLAKSALWIGNHLVVKPVVSLYQIGAWSVGTAVGWVTSSQTFHQQVETIAGQDSNPNR